MRLAEIDWPEVLAALEAVSARRVELLPVLAELPVAPMFHRDHAGEHVGWLVAQGVLEEAAPGGRLRHTAASRGLRVLLRAAGACEVPDADGEREVDDAIRAYLARNFTAAQRSVVLDGEVPVSERERRTLIERLTSVQWPRAFLALAEPGAFDADRAATVYGQAMDQAVHEVTCALVRRAAEGPLRIPLDISLHEDDLLPEAIAAGVRYFVLFPSLDDGVLEFGLLQRVRDDLQGEHAEPPQVVPGGLPPPRAHHVDDTESVFVHACTHPIRVKAATNELYKRDLDDLIAGLASVGTRIASEPRVANAVDALLGMGALEFGTTVSAGRCLLATAAGHAWMSEPAARRFESFLEGVRVASPAERMRRLSLSDGYYFPGQDGPERQWEALLDVYRGLPRDAAVPMERLVEYRARHQNPLGDMDLVHAPWLERAWKDILGRFLDWLGSLGGIVFARSGDEVVVGACAMGDYILGFRDEPPVAEASEARVVLQPNFEIVFLGSSPAAEAALARFSDRLEQGRVGTLFRITQASIMRAGAAGLTLEGIGSALAEHTDDVPANVQHEISNWHQRVRRVRATSGIVIECPDADTADRIEGATRGGALSRISPTILLATDRKAFDRAARSLAAHGIVFDLDLAADPVPRKKSARRRRRRRW